MNQEDTDAQLLTTAQMRQADAWAIAHGVPGIDLMERAGQAVFDAILARWTPRPVLVLCGPGNNGGDGHVVARLLEQAGWKVRLASTVPTDGLQGDTLHHSRQREMVAWGMATELLSSDDDAKAAALGQEMVDGGHGLVVDALFGAGLMRPLAPALTRLLRQVASAGVPIVAIDVPSGVQGDTGADWGAVRADLTVTFFRKKPAHVLMPGRALCGEIVVADIGIAPQALDDMAEPDQSLPLENGWPAWRHAWPNPGECGHKYHRGHVLVFGGARMVGAGRLAARAAARVGAGLVTLVVPQSAWAVYAARLMSEMVQGLPDGDGDTLAAAWRGQLSTLRWQALLLGPGAALGLPGEASATVRQLVLDALAQARQRPVVLDADALTAFEHQPQVLFEALARVAGPAVLTPHAGEFDRLFGTEETTHGMSKLTRTRAAARRSGAVVLFKGADTVIAAPDGRCVVNTGAPPWLATAGSGDVLAGFIVGLMAQGMPAMEAACAAAWVHGACAQAFGPGLLAEDLPEMMPRLLSGVLAEQGRAKKA